MPELTPEEKQKIYLEEKERLEVQARLVNEKKILADAKKRKDTKNVGIGCLVIVIIIGVIFVISIFNSSKSAAPKIQIPNLKADIVYSDKHSLILVKNNDSFDWSNIKIELNSGLLDSGYYYTAPALKAGGIATIGILNFAKSNGERLNPLSIKIRKVTVFADTPNGYAHYSGKWD